MEEPALSGGTVFSSWQELAKRNEGRIALAFLLLITIPMLTKIFTSDFGTHLAMGRQIVQTRSIPDREFLNYPSLGRYNPNAEWGFQALLYSVFAVGGEYGVSFLCWAVVLGIYVFLFQSALIRGANPFFTVLGIFAFSGFLRIRIQPRPEIFTYLFAAATMYILTEYYYGKRKRLLYLFPPLLLVWANMHPTYLVAFVLMAAYFIDGLARAAWRKEIQWDRLRGWVFPPIALGVAGLIFCGLNPLGFDHILMPLVVLSRGQTGGGGSGILFSISELTPVKTTGMYTLYKAAAIFTAISVGLGAFGRRLYILDLFLFGIAFKGAWDSARAVSMIGIFISQGTALHMTGFFERLKEWSTPTVKAEKKQEEAKGKKKKKDRGRVETEPSPVRLQRPRAAFARWIAIAAFVCAIAGFGGVTLFFSSTQLEYGVGITEHKFSFRAGKFLRENPVPGNMFNFFDIGGFLDWQLYPGALTFIDGRTYNHEVFMEHQVVTAAMPGWENTLAKYGVTYAVLKAMDSSGMILPIVPAMARHPEWHLVFADGLFVIFVKNTPETAKVIRKHEIPKDNLPKHILWEAHHYAYLGVSPVVVYQTMANMYELMGNRKAAIEILEKALEDEESSYLRARLMSLRQGGAPTTPPLEDRSPHGPR